MTAQLTALGNAARVSVPALIINNTADLACTPSHAQRLYHALGGSDKSHVDIEAPTTIIFSGAIY